MSPQPSDGQVYICPMHKDVRRPSPGVCSHCGMALIPEGARFGMFQHMLSSPRHAMVMGRGNDRVDGGRDDDVEVRA